MDSNGHESIGMMNLAEKLKTLPYRSGEERCIYRVSRPRRRLHPNDYDPQMVSIGPFHHGKEECKAMEENKLRYLHYFLQRTKVSMGDFFAFIKGNEIKLRNYYAEKIHFESDEFVTMILMDAVFLIEFFLRTSNRSLRTVDDPLFGNSELSFLGSSMRYDLYLIENQLPFFILSELFDLAKKKTVGNIYGEISFVTITSYHFIRESDITGAVRDMKLIEVNVSKARHFVDLLLRCLHQSQQPAKTKLSFQNIPSVKELHQAGVKFRSGSRSGSGECLLDITFNKDTLKIPVFKLFDSTERLYRNLLIFEKMHEYPVPYFNDYVIIMYYFVATPNDADLLIRNGIGIGDSETMSTVFHSLYKDCVKGSHLEYGDLIKDIQAYCRSPWNRWKANLKQNYFNTPWASISVIAAVLLLLLTITQTICALIAL